MGLETATYISDLVATNPTSSDPKSQGDDHIRLVKSTLQATFPNVAGAVTPTHTELNYVDGVTSAIQTQLDAKAPSSNPTITGGTINNCVIGGTTPAAGSFTSVSATGSVTSLVNGSSTFTAQSSNISLSSLFLIRRSKGNTTTPTGVSSGDSLGTIRWQGHDGSNFVNAASISVEVDGATGTTDMPGRMLFFCSPDGTASPTEYMRIANNGVTTIGGSTTTCALNVTPVASSVNYIKATGATTGNMPSIASAGSDTNVGLTVSTQGTGSFTFSTGGGTQFRVIHVASAVGYIRAAGAATGGAPYLEVISSDTNSGFQYYTQGTGSHQFRTGGGRDGALQLAVSDVVGAVNYGNINGSTTGNSVVYGAGGSDANIAVRISNKGTAVMELYGQTVSTTVGAAGGASALPATPTGYLSVNIDGTTYKIPYYAT